MAINWNEVKESQGGESLEPGCYVGRVVKARDFPDREYIRLEFDIAEGEHAGHFAERGWDGKFYYASYKETALGMFKAMFLRFEESTRATWRFNGDEHDAAQFVGREVGIVLREEEYADRGTGEIKTGLKIAKIVAAQDVRNGDARPMPPKKLKPGDAPATAKAADDYSDVPFTV